MKLSYREKIGLLIVIVLAVIIVFIAVPIKTIKGNIKAHTEEKETVQTEYDETQRLIAQIPGIESNIKKVVEESKALSKDFYAHAENVELDKLFEEVLNKAPYVEGGKNNIEITGNYNIDDAEADEFPFYCYVPDVVTYPILEKADTNGNLLETKDKALYEKAVTAVKISELQAQNIEVHRATVPMKFKKEALLSFEDELKSKLTGARIVSVKIDDYTFANASDVPEEKGFSDGEVVIEFYTMQQIQDPVFN